MRLWVRFEDYGSGYRSPKERIPEAIHAARVAILIFPLYSEKVCAHLLAPGARQHIKVVLFLKKFALQVHIKPLRPLKHRNSFKKEL